MNKPDIKNSFLSHIAELRKRIINSAIFFIIIFIICYIYSGNLLDIITAPLLNKHNSPSELIYTDLIEGFAVNLNIALFSSFILTLPFILYQIYSFISPALYKDEEKLIKYVFLAAVILLFLSIFFSYFIIFPNAWNFFLNYQTKIGKLELKFLPKITDYVTLSLQFILIFCIIFQLPIFLILLSINSFVTSAKLRKIRRIFIVLSFIIAAILTPPDIFSQIALAVPIILLYEISILIIKKIESRKIKNV